MSNIHSPADSLGIQGSVLTPSSPSYETAIQRNSLTSVLKPAFIIVPTSPDDVALALKFARSQNPPLEIAVKGGGCHTSSASSSEGGLVIDLSGLKSVKVSDDRKTISVGGGALWGDVYVEADKHDVAVVGGSVHFVGVAGLTLGGGYSNLSGKYGLAVDNLLQATVVLADGSVVTTSDTNETDLFWAIRGMLVIQQSELEQRFLISLVGGSNQFGIVTEFVFKAHPSPGPALVGAMVYPGTEIQNVLRALHVCFNGSSETFDYPLS